MSRFIKSLCLILVAYVLAACATSSTPVEEESWQAVAPILPAGFRGIGRELSDGKDATDYVKKLRQEWGNRSDAIKRS